MEPGGVLTCGLRPSEWPPFSARSVKRLVLLILISALAALSGRADGASADSLRQRINLNRDWKFHLGDLTGAEAPDFADKDWSPINLPHCFDIPYFMSNYYVGYGWYRKTLHVEDRWLEQRVNLEFLGAFQDAQVFVNGQRVGEHKGGYTGFSYDITSALHAGDNLVAVRLNNIRNPQLEPIGGDHIFMGGIYRDVYLVITNPLHVTWYGTFVTTPTVSKESATVNVKTEIQNQSSALKNCTVKTALTDPSGAEVAQFSSQQQIPAGATVTFDQTSPVLASPRLWSPAHPNLYEAHTTVSDGATPVDTYATSFGIRSIKWTADQGFFLNGEHLYFHGANVHQDHAGWGIATTDYASFRDVQFVKDAGLDFIRGSHYPHHPKFADACDQLGLLFWSENCFWAGYPGLPKDQDGFDQSAKDTLRDEIRIFRNHPSIVVWSMCNEVFGSSSPRVRTLLTALVQETHQLDPTRPAAIGGCQRGNLDKLGDIAGYNGDGASMAEFQNPGIPNVVSEYGSHISDRGGPDDKYDGMFDRSLPENAPEYPWRSGQSLWCAFDYGTVLGRFGHMGFMDNFRIPKKSWYWYREHNLHIPPPAFSQEGVPAQLKLTADKTTLQGTDGTDDCQILVTVEDKEGHHLSNSLPVTFAVESGPGEFPTGRSITFNPDSDEPKSDIRIADGLAAMEFRSYFAGTTVIRATSPGLQDDTITVHTTGEPVYVPGQSPPVPDRAYVVKGWIKNECTPLDENLRKITELSNGAVNHPVSSSGDAPDHPAPLANDGDAKTYWQAAQSQPGAYWQVDLEALCSVQAVEATFPERGYFYKVEGSTDGTQWNRLVDRGGGRYGSHVTDRQVCLPNQDVRFVRITFTGLPKGKPAILCEFQVFALGTR